MNWSNLIKYVGLVLFVGAIGFLAWWWLALPARATTRGGPMAALTDVALFSMFALHHSLLARTGAKKVVSRLLPQDLVRSVYVWVASILLLAMCLLWQPIGGELYRARGLAVAPLIALQLAGLLVSLLAVKRISIRELAGVRAPRPDDALQYSGPYRLVRHPLYLGWVLIFFPATQMTGDRLLFAVVSTLYLLVAMPLEEQGLTAQFGARYLEYRQAVRWRLIPYVH